jgi:hypothetical protein
MVYLDVTNMTWEAEEAAQAWVVDEYNPMEIEYRTDEGRRHIVFYLK